MLENIEKENQSLREKLLLAEEKLAVLMDEYEQLKQAFIQAQRERFGKKSERFVDENQQLLFPDDTSVVEVAPDPEDEEDLTFTGKEAETNTPKEPRKARTNKKSLIPTREVIIPVPEENRICDCGCEKKGIGFEVSHRLNYTPAVFEMWIEKREKMACGKGCSGVVVAPLVPRILPKCRVTESLLAYIAVSKVLDRQPLYHLEKSIEQRYHWRLPRQTMARWLIQLSEPLMPLINAMTDTLLNYPIAAIDATTLQVLQEPNRAPETKSQAYCIRGGPPGKEVVLYEYNAYSQKDYVTAFFTDYQGVVHCDASPVFNGIRDVPGINLSYCHAHARRKFEQIEKADKKGKHPLAKQAMQFYSQLYKIEREATNQNLSPEARLALRQAKSLPLLNAFKTWLDQSQHKTLPKSPIGQAIAYCLNHWAGLQTYLTDGRLQIDNNATERDIKPFVMARKNFLFACTQKGADALAVHFSLILTAQYHGLNPLTYYEAILQKIPLCNSFQDFDALLPWNFNKNAL